LKVVTLSAMAESVFPTISILWCVLMPLGTMDFGALNFPGDTAPHILRVRHNFHVPRIYTSAIAAEMVQLKALRHWFSK
jgi:hypothetical protein